MVSFQAKIGWKMVKKRENKNYRSFPFLTNTQWKIRKKQQKKLKKIIMAAFQAKIGWKMLRKRENKNYRFVSFLPNEQQKIPKKF